MAGYYRKGPATSSPVSRVGLDIETFPTDAAWEAPYDASARTPPKNLKDPDKIAAWYDKDRDEWEASRSDSALSWLTGRVAMVAIYTPDGKSQVMTAKTEAEEPAVLDAVQQSVLGQRLYTWNGRDFDLRFLIGRLLLRRVTPLRGLATGWFKKWNTPEHYDVRWGLMGGVWAKGTLKEVAAAFGLPTAGTAIANGAEAVRAMREGRWSEVEPYCLQDAQWTHQLGVMAEQAGLE